MSNNYKDEHCPVCGYYCLGKGGAFCIDKPALCGYTTDDEAEDEAEIMRILGLSDEEVLAEMRQQGLDPDEEVAKARAMIKQIKQRINAKNA